MPRKYTPAAGPITHLQTENSSAPRPIDAAALQLAYAPDASRLALAAADGAVSLLKLPTRRHARATPPQPPRPQGGAHRAPLVAQWPAAALGLCRRLGLLMGRLA